MKITKLKGDKDVSISPGLMIGDGDYGWQIQYDCRWSGGSRCHHCGPITHKVHLRSDGSTFTESFWSCPRMICAKTDSHIPTGVCLDCVLEAVQKIDEKQKRPRKKRA
jgi:hypothetical protein